MELLVHGLLVLTIILFTGWLYSISEASLTSTIIGILLPCLVFEGIRYIISNEVARHVFLALVGLLVLVLGIVKAVKSIKA